MITSKVCLLSVCLLSVSGLVIAEDYVPPPTGPYQSSVIINNDGVNPDSTGQVYRFPSDVLIHKEYSKPQFGIEKSKHKPEQKLTEQKLIPADNTPPEKQSTPVITAPASAKPAAISRNPWAVDSVTFPNRNVDNAYPRYQYQNQGIWNNPQYSYPQQYQYRYNNQNNFMNNPFSSMLSPWSAMPMQPFFSGK